MTMAIKDAKEYICALGVDDVIKTYGKENVPKVVGMECKLSCRCGEKNVGREFIAPFFNPC